MVSIPLRQVRDPRRRRQALVAGVGAAALLALAVGAATVRWGLAGFAAGLALSALVLIVAVASAAVAVGFRGIERLRELEERSDVDRDDIERRLASIERILEVLSDRDVASLQGRAEELLAAGRLDEAATAFEQAIALRTHDPALRAAHLRALKELHASGDATRRYIAAIKHQMGVGNHDHAREIAEQGFADSPRSLRIRDLLVALLDDAGEIDRALNLAAETAQLRIRRLERLRPQPPDGASARAQRTFIAGYFYSGSGAVLDYLRGLEGVLAWPPFGELRLVKFPGGFADLSAAHANAGGLPPQPLVDLYLHLTGWKSRGVAASGYDKWAVINRNSRKLFRTGAATAGYLAVCLRSFLQLVETRTQPGSTTELEATLREWLECALQAAASDNAADHLVINQAMTAWRLDLARFAPPSNFVLVHRDPRDQFSEVRQVLEQPGRSTVGKDPADFAARYRRDRRRAELAIATLEREQGHRVLQVSFEDFVVDHDRAAAEVVEYLGLAGRALLERRFQPEESRANVGKHREHLSARERDILCRELPEYLHPAADG